MNQLDQEIQKINERYESHKGLSPASDRRLELRRVNKVMKCIRRFTKAIALKEERLEIVDRFRREYVEFNYVPHNLIMRLLDIFREKWN